MRIFALELNNDVKGIQERKVYIELLILFPHGCPADPKKSVISKRINKTIRFYGEDLVKGNWLFRQFVLKPDTKAGIKEYYLKR